MMTVISYEKDGFAIRLDLFQLTKKNNNSHSLLLSHQHLGNKTMYFHCNISFVDLLLRIHRQVRTLLPFG